MCFVAGSLLKYFKVIIDYDKDNIKKVFSLNILFWIKDIFMQKRNIDKMLYVQYF